nr:dethiobiotin synthase [uncultured Roseateles sp.]
MRGLFVTGTDTEIGKTCVSAGLAHRFAQAGLKVAAIKPVAAGQEFVEGRWINEDVQRLREAGNMNLSDAEVGPLQFRAACAPHIAARLEGRTIECEPLLAAVRGVAERADVAVVEGVGGFRVPLNADWDTADLAVDLQLPVVLVVGLRLGCINHALLTAEAIRSRGLTLAGWVANTVDPDMPHQQDNLQALRQHLGAPCWGLVPRLESPTPSAVAAALNHHVDQFLVETLTPQSA